MTYNLITEDFLADLTALSSVVESAHGSGASAKSRVASINSAILLLASTFEEFVRQMGRQYARDVVMRIGDSRRLPKKLTATAWKRTLEQLSRARIDTGGTPLSLDHISADSRTKIDAVISFLGGDITQDIYGPLIHNENNMRPNELNSVFAVCDLPDICRKICEHDLLKQHFDTEDPARVHGRFITSLNDFMEIRNEIAHALNSNNSIGPDSFRSYVSEFRAIALALSDYLPTFLPAAAAEA